MADARVSVTGHARLVAEDQQAAFRHQYMQKNKESFWADFGDFKAYHMSEVLAVHFNGGFGRAGTKVGPLFYPMLELLCFWCCSPARKTAVAA